MTMIIVATKVDPTRVGLTYKIELQEWAFEEWWEQKRVRELVAWEFAQTHRVGKPYKDANTGVMVFHDSGEVEVHNFAMSERDLVALLQSADYDFGNEQSGKPGRPEKRVLISTTSKERRTKSSLTRQAVY